MIIAVVSDVLGEENNGTTIAAMNLIRSLKAKGHEVRVICPDADKAGEDGYYIVKTLNVGPFNNYVKKNGVNISKPDKKVVAKALKGVDAVHVMVPFQDIVTNTAFPCLPVSIARQKIFLIISF